MKLGLWICFFLLSPGIVLANESKWKVKASFSRDTIQIGEPVLYSLSVHYPFASQVVFPDTGYVFGSFELWKREFFPTRTIGALSRDCVVYHLATFSLDPIQMVRIPVFERVGEDTILHYPSESQVYLKSVFTGNLPTKPVVQTEISPLPVPKRVNYPYILIGLGVVTVLILLVNIFFDRPIQKFIFLFLERRRHSAFIRQFEKLSQQMEVGLSVEAMENLLITWKKYLQRVDGKPYTTFTSREIFQVLPDATLRDYLQEIDRWIYGGLEMKDFRSNVLYLKQIALMLYQQKREAIRNGKFE